jgi:hypothetical protein
VSALHGQKAGGLPLMICVRTIPTEGAPFLRSLQGWDSTVASGLGFS